MKPNPVSLVMCGKRTQKWTPGIKMLLQTAEQRFLQVVTLLLLFLLLVMILLLALCLRL